MDNGWIKLHRSILKWEWWDDRNTRDLFIYCLLMANHDTLRWHGITIPRGSFITSLPKLAKGVGITVSQTRTALEHLELTGELTRSFAGSTTTISICNYERYQDTKEVFSQAISQADSREIADESQANRRLIAANKNDKNIIIKKEEENNISLSNARVREGGDAGLGVMVAVDDLLQEVLLECENGSMGMVSMCRLYGLQMPQVKEAAAIFADKLKADGTTRKARGDFRHHFNSWLKLNVKQLFFNDNGKQQGVTDDFILRTAERVAANGGLAF